MGRRNNVTGRTRVFSYPKLPRCLPTIRGGSSNIRELMGGMNLYYMLDTELSKNVRIGC